MDEARENDPKRQKTLAVIYQIHRQFGDQPFTTNMIVERVNEVAHYNNSHIPTYRASALRSAVLAIAAPFSGKDISPDKLGRFLSSYRDRIVGGYELRRAGISHRAIKWQIIRHSDALDYEDEIVSTTEPDTADILSVARHKLGAEHESREAYPVTDPHVAEIMEKILPTAKRPDEIFVCEPIADFGNWASNK